MDICRTFAPQMRNKVTLQIASLLKQFICENSSVGRAQPCQG